jgi:hypothetical protein
VYAVFCPCRSALVDHDHHSAKKVLILTMKLWIMKKSSDFDHEKMNLVEKNVGFFKFHYTCVQDAVTLSRICAVLLHYPYCNHA